MLGSTVVIAIVLAAAVAEPPIDNRYLPPAQRLNGGFGSPSQTYGPPDVARFSPQRQTEAVFGSVSPNYNSPRARPSSTYGAPRNSRPSNQYLPPAQPSSQYGPPNTRFGGRNSQPKFGNNSPSNQYGAPQRSNSAQRNDPSPQYNAPSTQYGAPSQFGQERFNAPSQFSPQSNPSSQYLPPSGQYGAPNEEEFGLQRRANEQYRTPMPSGEYGAPGYDNAGGQQSNFRSYENEQSPGEAGYPGARGYAGGDDGSNEPANYSFEYMVKDDASGNDFGHRESRMGDRAEGLYYVLLPDGRKQSVQYEADQDGYKPRISYEDVGSGADGYDRNSQSRSQGGPY